jgi:hypothetical protein
MKRTWTWLLAMGIAAACGDDGGEASDTGAGSSSTGTDESSSGGVPNAFPTIEAVVDAAALCGGGADSIEIRATRVGCEDPPPAPCTLPNPPMVEVGDQLACPSDETAAALRAEIMIKGRYNVEVATITGTSESVECFADGPEAPVLVSEGQLASKPTIAVSGLGEPCPAP